jgi:hypothetical protein
VIALWAAYGVSQFGLAGDWEGLGVVAVGAAGRCAIIILRIGDAVYTSFWLAIRGGLRPQIPWQQHGHLLPKDILVVLVYLSFYASRRKGIR